MSSGRVQIPSSVKISSCVKISGRVGRAEKTTLIPFLLYSAYCDYTSTDMMEGTCPTVSVMGVAMGEPKEYKCKLWSD